MTAVRTAAAVVAGLVLAALPFAHYGAGGHAPHADHEPRHGGQLGMVGDHHIELVRRGGELEAYVSDAWRRGERPRAGRLVFDRADAADLVQRDDHLVGADRPQAREIEVEVVLDDGTRLATAFDYSDR